MDKMYQEKVTKSDSDDKAAAASTYSQPKQTGNQAAGPKNIASKPSDQFLVAKGHTQVTQQGVKRRSGGQSVVSASDGAPRTTAQGGVDPRSILGLGNAIFSMVSGDGDGGSLQYVPSTNPVQRPVHKGAQSLASITVLLTVMPTQ